MVKKKQKKKKNPKFFKQNSSVVQLSLENKS